MNSNQVKYYVNVKIKNQVFCHANYYLQHSVLTGITFDLVTSPRLVSNEPLPVVPDHLNIDRGTFKILVLPSKKPDVGSIQNQILIDIAYNSKFIGVYVSILSIRLSVSIYCCFIQFCTACFQRNLRPRAKNASVTLQKTPVPIIPWSSILERYFFFPF